MKRIERALALFLSLLLVVVSLHVGTIVDLTGGDKQDKNIVFDGGENQIVSEAPETPSEKAPEYDDGNPVPYVPDSTNDGTLIDPEAEVQPYEQVEKYDYDTIVAEAEQKQAYRDSVEYVEDTIVFSVLNYRAQGDAATYLTSNDPLCQKYNLKNISFILETNKSDVQQKENMKPYQMFYSASVKADDIWQVVDELAAEENVLSAEPDFLWEKSDIDDMTEISGETLAAEVESCGWSYTDLDCMNIWNGLTSGHAPGEGVVVAVIDTGVDYNHIDLRRNMWVNSGEISDNGIDDDGNGYIDDVHGINLIDPAKQGDPMDDMGHGTHVAGIIGMTAGNGGGVGIAYGSKIMAIKAGQASGYFASTDIAKAIVYAAANGADVINMSFGGTGKSSLVEAALADAFGSCVLVAAAGNDGLPTTDCPLDIPKEDIYPAGYSYVLGVMACDDGGNKAGFSNWDYYKYANCEYEMIAPGVNVFSTLPGNRYAKWSGTSMAAPMVSATAAIIRREYRDKNKYSPRFVMGQLCEATKDKVNYVDPYGGLHVYSKLNINDSLGKIPKPSISVSDIHFFDSKSISESNNSDGVIQAGETIDLGFVVTNRWGIAKDIEVEVDALSVAGIPNPYITFLNNRIEFDDEVGAFTSINNGFVYDNDMLVGVDNPIRLKVSDDAPNDLLVTINFTVKGKNGMDEIDHNYYGVFGDNKYVYTFNVQRGTYLRGEISEDMTLTPDKLWIVDHAVLIPEGVTISVDPGTNIQFYNGNDMVNTCFYVRGELNCNGTQDNPINIFPCKAMENYAVEMCKASPDKGIINFSYTNIVNPFVSADRGDHLKLLYNEPYDTRVINRDGIRNLESGVLLVFDDLLNTRIINSAPGRVIANLDTVLCNKSLASFNPIVYQVYAMSNEFGTLSTLIDVSMRSSRNSVFLGNYGEEERNYYYVDALEADNFFVEFTQNALLYRLNSKGRMIISPPFNSMGYAEYNFSMSVNGNYWGTTNTDDIEKMIYDRYDNPTFPRADYSNYLTLDDDMSSIYPFVTEAYVTDLEGNRLSEVANSQTVQVHVKFNRDMSQAAEYKPMVSFGPAEPYTDYVVNGDWVSAREWVGTIQIDPFINQGTEYLRIKDAAAADDLWLTTGTDEARFSFDITKTSAEALTLQGSGGSNSNYLNWVQDDYDTLAGYNLYRSTAYDKETPVEEQGFEKINTTIIPNDVKEYTDTEVEQGVDYYYYFTVVDTQFKESPASNVVKCTPLDEEAPVIITRAIETKTEGTTVAIAAEITDNVEVKGAKLFYRMEGEENWKQLIMRNTTGDTYQASIPAYDILQGVVEYYIVAEDGENTSTAGSADMPNVFTVKGVTAVESISLDKTFEELQLGSTLKITASVYPEDATYPDVTWSSFDDSIATVDDEGNVTAVGIGEVIITATSSDGTKAAICGITVTPILVSELNLQTEEKTVQIGNVFRIIAEVLPEKATKKDLIFRSDHPEVATVDEEGRVRTVGVGEANILVTTTDGSDLSKTFKVTVNPINVQVVALDAVMKELEVGENFKLHALVFPDNATNRTVCWTTSNPDVVSIENDSASGGDELAEGNQDGAIRGSSVKVTALKSGKAIITVTSEDGSKKAICSITVKADEESIVSVEDIELSKTELKLVQGESDTLTAVVKPDNATNKEVKWSTSNSRIVTVDANGLVSAVGIGKAFIICRAEDSSDKLAVCSVEVVEKVIVTESKVIKAEQDGKRINIEWNASDIAEKYRVLRKVDNGDFVAYAKVSGTTYVDKNIEEGKKYTYTVRTIDKNGKQSTTYDKTGMSVEVLDFMPHPTLERTEEGVLVQWNPAFGAAKYRVMKKNENGKWIALCKTTKLSYLDKDVEEGKTYIYTVRSIDETGAYYGEYNTDGESIELSAEGENPGENPGGEPTNLATSVNSLELSGTESGIALSWNAVDGVYRYRVLRKDESGDFVAVVKTANTTYVDTNVEEGRTYTYTIRMIGTDGKYYGEYNTEGWSIQK